MMAQIAILAGPAAAGQPESLATAQPEHACIWALWDPSGSLEVDKLCASYVYVAQ